MTLVEQPDIGEAWERIVEELGGQVKRPGTPSASADVTRWLQERGLQPQEIHVASWETSKTVCQEMEGIRQRLWASTWSVPDDLFAQSMKCLEQWVNAELGMDWNIERKR